jgi:hypothetical protein
MIVSKLEWRYLLGLYLVMLIGFGAVLGPLFIDRMRGRRLRKALELETHDVS